MGLILPHFCVQCRNPTDAALCARCRRDLELLTSHGRCRTCFGDDDLIESDLCVGCLELPLYHSRAASCLAYEGVGGALVRAMKYGNCAYLARGGAAILLLQLEALGWEVPDCIVPVPMPRLRRLLRGYNQSHLLGEALGKLLGVPCVRALGRRSGLLPQAALAKSGRQGKGFFQRSELRDKHVLLVDDVLTTGTTVSYCGVQLVGAGARNVDILTLCRATW